jgi:hypothetical protein
MLRVPLLALLAQLLGCSLSPAPFTGAVIEMTLTGAQPSAAGQHFELWARNANDDTVRISGIRDIVDPKDASKTIRLEPKGFVVRPAITMDDPCMIDDAGHLLVTPDAYPSTITIGGITQTPEEQAAQVRARIAQLDDVFCDGSGQNPASHCGHEPTALLAVVPYELVQPDGSALVPPPRPTIPFTAPPDQRLSACQQYWSASPLAYTPNPAQLTAPLHGAAWGFVTYNTTAPPANYDAIRIDSGLHLAGIRELFITVEPDAVDAIHRGPTYLRGTPDPGGDGWVHFDLAPPFGSSLPAAGTAALFVDPDQNPSKL